MPIAVNILIFVRKQITWIVQTFKADSLTRRVKQVSSEDMNIVVLSAVLRI